MAIDTTSPRTRRAILMGAFGVVAASAAAAVGRASRVSAADGDTVQVGHHYFATHSTAIDATGDHAIIGSSDSDAGVNGNSVTGTGVDGQSNTGTGVQGNSGSGYGVVGISVASDKPAILGQSLNKSTGVQGYSGKYVDSPPAPVANTGVYGRADQAHGLGVYGQTTDATSETYGVHGRVAGDQGRGVFGWATITSSGGTGVWGQSNSSSGVGVRGYAWDGDAATGDFGTGVLGSSGSHAYPPPAARANTGVMGVAVGDSGIGTLGTCGSGTGVQGSSTSGTAVLGVSTSGVGVRGASNSHRGGVFTSPVAPLRLYPAKATTHPSAGLVGDLFVDAAGDLWYCKGGTTWVKLA